MASRLELHEILCDVLGSRNVYFQPPASVLMKYPAIRYSLRDINNTFADNSVYRQSYSYEVTAIDKNPDSDIPRRLSRLPMCRFDRHYVADNLYHYTFTVYY